MLVLPPEIVVCILARLPARDLLVCSRVCRLLRDLVCGNARCQYAIELAAAGMQDGPPSSAAPADRLAVLRSSQAAWHSLQWTALSDVRMLPGSLYELYAGVLVQSNSQSGRGLVFRRLPSRYRGIGEQVWSLNLDIAIRDFTLDPAQDLLVLIAQPVIRANRRTEITIHLRSLTTGHAHSLATQPPVLVHEMDAANLSFMIQAHSDRIAVQFADRGGAPPELVVWNWKTGDTLLNTYGPNLMASAFLTERLILIGGFKFDGLITSQLRLFVIDTDSTGGQRTVFNDVDYLCSFQYPVCYPWIHPLSFLIRSDPASAWLPHPSAQVPFSIGPGPRLYIVTIWVVHGEEIAPIDLFFLSNTLLDRIALLREDERRRDFEWSEWGPAGTRMVVEATPSDGWVCYVCGTRFSSITDEDGEETSRILEVWDFNQPGIKRDIGRQSSESGMVEWHVGDVSVLRDPNVFVNEIETRLPYRVSRRQLDPPSGGEPVFKDAMCSEDSVILVDSHTRHFRILTF